MAKLNLNKLGNGKPVIKPAIPVSSGISKNGKSNDPLKGKITRSDFTSSATKVLSGKTSVTVSKLPELPITVKEMLSAVSIDKSVKVYQQIDEVQKLTTQFSVNITPDEMYKITESILTKYSVQIENTDYIYKILNAMCDITADDTDILSLIIAIYYNATDFNDINTFIIENKLEYNINSLSMFYNYFFGENALRYKVNKVSDFIDNYCITIKIDEVNTTLSKTLNQYISEASLSYPKVEMFSENYHFMYVPNISELNFGVSSFRNMAEVHSWYVKNIVTNKAAKINMNHTISKNVQDEFLKPFQSTIMNINGLTLSNDREPNYISFIYKGTNSDFFINDDYNRFTNLVLNNCRFGKSKEPTKPYNPYKYSFEMAKREFAKEIVDMIDLYNSKCDSNITNIEILINDTEALVKGLQNTKGPFKNNEDETFIITENDNSATTKLADLKDKLNLLKYSRISYDNLSAAGSEIFTAFKNMLVSSRYSDFKSVRQIETAEFITKVIYDFFYSELKKVNTSFEFSTDISDAREQIYNYLDTLNNDINALESLFVKLQTILKNNARFKKFGGD